MQMWCRQGFFYWFYFWWLLHGLYKFIFSVKYLALTLIWWLSLFRYWTGAAELQNKPWPVRLETPCIYLLKVSITTSLQFSTELWSDVIVLSLNRWISIDDLAKPVLIKTLECRSLKLKKIESTKELFTYVYCKIRHSVPAERRLFRKLWVLFRIFNPLSPGVHWKVIHT